MRALLLVLVSSCEGLLLPPPLRIRAPVTRRALTLFQMISKGAEQSADTTSRSQESEAKARNITIALPPIDPVPSLTLLILVFVAWQLGEQSKMLGEQGKMLVELTSEVKDLDAKISQPVSFLTLVWISIIYPIYCAATFLIIYSIGHSFKINNKGGEDKT